MKITSVGGVVTRARLMQSRAWAARVSGARGARCAPLTAPVGVLVEIALHVQHHQGRCALSLYRRARRTSSNFRLSLLVFSLSLCVSLSRRVSPLPALCSRLCSRLCSAFVSAGASSLRFVGATLSRSVSVFADVLHSSLLSTLFQSVLSLPLLRLSLVAWPFLATPTLAQSPVVLLSTSDVLI